MRLRLHSVRSTSVASVDFDLVDARFTFHCTTPLERTLAILVHCDGLMSVAPPTAKMITTPNPPQPRLTATVPGPQGTKLPVWLAVVRGFRGIHEIVFTGGTI